MTKSRNNAHLLKQWGFALAMALLAIFVMAANITSQSPIRYVLPTIIVMILVFIIWRQRTMAADVEAKLRKMLRSSSPNALHQYYQDSFGRAVIPDKDAYLVFSNALALLLYGEFDLGQEEIDKIKWSDRIPMVRAQRPLFLALRSYIERGDHRQGLAFAQEARALADVWKVFHGAGTSLNLYDAAIDIGHALGGFGPDVTGKAVARLEARLPRSLLLLQLVVAWALGTHYQQSGRIGEATRMRASLRVLAPYCRGLTVA